MADDQNTTDEGAGTSLAPVKSNQLGLTGDLNELVQYAQLMAKAKALLPAHFHNAPGECLAIVTQARDWGMNPFAVGQKTSIINNRLMYEGQLVQAVINRSGILAERFSFTFEGDGEAKICTATARIKNDKEPKQVKVGMPKNGEARNSPLWKSDPEQQLTYKACRVWMRRYAPEVMMAIYTPEDDWSEDMPVVASGPIDQRIAALTTQPGEPINTIEGSVVKDDPFAEGAVTITQTTPLPNSVQAVEEGDHPGCYECLDKGIIGGCPSCGREPGNGEG